MAGPSASNRFRLREIFSSTDRAYGIPDLDPEFLCRCIPSTLLTYGAIIPTEGKSTAAISFFTEDWRFNVAWNYPDRMLATLRRHNFLAACEPDFSTWLDLPRIEQLHAIYRRRWCGRFWQQHGIQVIPTISWSDDTLDALIGIPAGTPIVCAQTQTTSDWPTKARLLSESCQRIECRHLLLYGIEKPLSIPRVSIHWYPPFTAQMRQRMSVKQRVTNT